MNTQFLKFAVEIEKTGSISKAAQNLYLNQPRLSKSIKELERSVGIKIFKRTPRGMVPTDEGKTFLELAKNIIVKIDEINSLGNAKSKIVFLSIFDFYIDKILKNILSNTDELSNVVIKHENTTTQNIIYLMKRHECDFGIIRLNNEDVTQILDELTNNQIRISKICEFKPVAICTNNSDIKNNEVALSYLKNFDEISNTSLPFAKLSDAKLETSYINKDVFLKTNFAFSSPYFVPNDFKTVKIDDADVYSDYLIYKKTPKIKPILDDVLPYISAIFD